MDTFFNIFPNGIPEIDRRSGIKKLAPVGGTTQKGDKEKEARTTNKI
jgi:hypothetical protein